jgi:hypothetical protein
MRKKAKEVDFLSALEDCECKEWSYIWKSAVSISTTGT